MKKNDNDFLKLLNADSLFELSLTEKIVYESFYLGLTDQEAANALNMSRNTIASYRRRLRRQYQASLSIIEMCNMMDFDTSPRKYSTNRTDKNRIIIMDKNNRITGVYAKSMVHSTDAPLLHPSVIILPFTRKNDKLFFVICEKNKGIIFEISHFDSTVDTRIYTDIPGGHLKPERLPELSVGVKIDDSLWRRAAVSELNEELRIIGGNIDESRLRFLFFDRSSQRLPGTEGFNNELSAVFAYRMDDVPESKVRIFDEYTDSLGEPYRYRFPSRFVTYDELREIAKGTHDKYQPMDALLRTVSRLEEEPSLIADLNRI